MAWCKFGGMYQSAHQFVSGVRLHNKDYWLVSVTYCWNFYHWSHDKSALPNNPEEDCLVCNSHRMNFIWQGFEYLTTNYLYIRSGRNENEITLEAMDFDLKTRLFVEGAIVSQSWHRNIRFCWPLQNTINHDIRLRFMANCCYQLTWPSRSQLPCGWMMNSVLWNNWLLNIYTHESPF